ncbi:MAG: DUF1572 family protein [Gemmatimonadaceae bacterium]
MSAFESQFVDEAVSVFRRQQKMAERAMSQLEDTQLFDVLDPEMNSVAVIVKHMHGNMLSRWTDFLTTDGEKPDRQRDDEFIAPDDRSREQVMAWWSAGWDCVFAALAALRAEDVGGTVHIRGESLSVTMAVLRQVDHYGHHVGQIVFLAKHLRGGDWTTLSIPRGKSHEFNAKLMGTPESR